MHFCKNCDNMYYLQIDPQHVNKLVYYCRNCGTTETELTADDMCVLKTQVKRTQEKYSHIVNEFTKEDPTLPRIKTIKCPNSKCKSNTDTENVEREVIYIRYDDENMKYIYVCGVCDTTWKTSSKG